MVDDKELVSEYYNDKNRSFSDVLTNFADSTTCHAPPKVLNHKFVAVKMFWLVCFFTGIGVFIFYFSEILTDYLKYETMTGTELKFSMLDFPAVTFCNQNQFRQDKLPNELKELTTAFLEKKRQEMFGGQAGFQKFVGASIAETNEGTDASSTSGENTPVNEGMINAPTSATATKQAASNVGTPTTQAPSSSAIQGAVGASPTAVHTQPTASSTAEQSTSTAASDAVTTKGAGGTTTSAAVTQAANGATIKSGNARPTSQGPSTPAASNKGQAPPTTKAAPSSSGKRKKRDVYVLNDSEMETMDSLTGFYLEPSLDAMSSMSWFDNVGEQSSENDIMLNISSVISEMDEKELVLYGHSVEEMLQECSFLGRVCGPADFRQFFDRRYGNCFTFNHGMDGNVTRISSPGKSFGLTLILFINQPKYVSVLSPEAGARLMLHRHGQIPLMQEEGFDVQPGTNNGIGVKYVEISREGGQYSNCTNNLTTPEAVYGGQLYPGNYSQKACIKTCLQDAVIGTCRCANPLYRKPNTVYSCTPDEMADCVEVVEKEYLEKDTCVYQCPLPCWESQYQFSISSSQWPSNGFMPYLAESLKERGDDFKSILATPRQGLSENFIKLTIYYDNLNYYKYTESPKITPEDLIGAIGGHLGLWIGMSLISVLELFEFVGCVLAFMYERLTRKRSSVGSEISLRTTTTPVKKFVMD